MCIACVLGIATSLTVNLWQDLLNVCVLEQINPVDLSIKLRVEDTQLHGPCDLEHI